MTQPTELLFGDLPNSPTPPVELLFGLPAPEPVGGVELLFGDPPNSPHPPVHLLMGEGEAPPSSDTYTLAMAGQLSGLRGRVAVLTVPEVSVAGRITGLRGSIAVVQGSVAQAQGQLSGLRGSITAVAVQKVGLTGRLSGLRGSIGAVWDVNVSRPVAGGIHPMMHAAVPIATGVQERFQQALPMQRAQRSTWQDAQTLAELAKPSFVQAERLATPLRLRASEALAVALAPLQSGFEQAQHLRHAVRFGLQQGAPLRQGLFANYEEAIRLRNGIKSTMQPALCVRSSLRDGFTDGLRWQVRGLSRYQQAIKPKPGISPPRPVIPPKPPFTGNPDLEFGEGGGIVITPKRAYIVLNSITLVRLDTGAVLHAHGFSMSLDYQSWTWQWSASLHHDAAAHLGRDAQNEPPVLVATVNGVPFRLRLEKLSRDRRFNPTRWAVSGRGLAATLAAPWAPKRTFSNSTERTAQQLMSDVLSINGVSIGWDVDWQITDWLVPANAWALQGSTIEAVTDIAGAVGAYIQPHATEQILRVLPKYPAAPWDWPTLITTPDFDLPKDVAEVEGTEYIDKPAYNRVFVGGQGMGVFGPVTRAGTIGDVLAPQVLHPLITDIEAHRQRGLAELSDTGTQEHISLTMQVLPDTGVITPGKSILYRGHDKDYLGIVRATSINWQSPKLRQTLTLETHAL